MFKFQGVALASSTVSIRIRLALCCGDLAARQEIFCPVAWFFAEPPFQDAFANAELHSDSAPSSQHKLRFFFPEVVWLRCAQLIQFNCQLDHFLEGDRFGADLG
jgi:hypothetical protein